MRNFIAIKLTCAHSLVCCSPDFSQAKLTLFQATRPSIHSSTCFASTSTIVTARDHQNGSSSSGTIGGRYHSLCPQQQQQQPQQQRQSSQLLFDRTANANDYYCSFQFSLSRPVKLIFCVRLLHTTRRDRKPVVVVENLTQMADSSEELHSRGRGRLAFDRIGGGGSSSHKAQGSCLWNCSSQQSATTGAGAGSGEHTQTTNNYDLANPSSLAPRLRPRRRLLEAGARFTFWLANALAADLR